MLNDLLHVIEGHFIHCPRCLHRLPIREEITQDLLCEECGYLIPQGYINGYKEAPPVFVQFFGLPATGKTTYLNTLFAHLHEMDRLWENFYAQPLTQFDMDSKTTVLLDYAQGRFAESTQKRELDQMDVRITALKHMPRWGSRTIVAMDHAGEQFEKLLLDGKDMPFLLHTPVTILLLSLSDLTREGKRVTDLIYSYVHTLEAHKGRLEQGQRRLIILFSKADLLQNLPQDLQNYLSNDNLYLELQRDPRDISKMPEAEIAAYLVYMETISQMLRVWVAKTLPGGQALLNMLDGKGVDTRFTLVSNTGFAPAGTSLMANPRRVMDPFFWALEYYRFIRPQNAVRADLGTIRETFSPALRSAGSLLQLALLLFGGLLVSLFSAQSSPAWASFTLALLALLVSTLVYQWLSQPVASPLSPAWYPPPQPQRDAGGQQPEKAPLDRNPASRRVLHATRLALALACVVMIPVAPVQDLLAHLTFGQILIAFLLGSALFTCFQPPASQALFSRVILAVLAGTAALLQFSFGSYQALQSMNIQINSFDGWTLYNQVNLGISWGLLVIGVIVLFMSGKQRHVGDRLLFLVVLAPYLVLQYAYGVWELQQRFPGMEEQNAAIANGVLMVLVSLLALTSLVYLYRHERWDRLPLLFLVILSAGQLAFLNDGVIWPIGSDRRYVLIENLASFLTPDHLLGFGLVAACVVVFVRLFPRFRSEFTFLDHIMLYLAGLLCAQLLTSAWGGIAPQGVLDQISSYLLEISSLVAGILVLLVKVCCALAAMILFIFPFFRQFKGLKRLLKGLNERFFEWFNHLSLPLAYQKQLEQTQDFFYRRASWLTHLPTWSEAAIPWLERVLAAMTTLGCMFLAELYGQVIPLSPIAQGGTAVYAYQLVALAYAIFTVITLFRLGRPLERGARLLLLVNLIWLTLFVFLQAIPLLPIIQFLHDWSQPTTSSIPLLIFAFLVIFCGVVSLWWYRHSSHSGDRRLLQVLSVLVLVGGVLLLGGSVVVSAELALISLMVGLVIAAIA